MELERRQNEEAEARRSQIGTGDRSEKIRTYNFPQGRVTDHRIKLTLYKIDAIMDGDLDELIDSLIAADQAAKLAKLNESLARAKRECSLSFFVVWGQEHKALRAEREISRDGRELCRRNFTGESGSSAGGSPGDASPLMGRSPFYAGSREIRDRWDTALRWGWREKTFRPIGW